MFMKNRLVFFTSIIVLLFLSLVHTGCGDSNNQKKASANSTTTAAPKQFNLPPYLAKFKRPAKGTKSDWMAPVNNATVTFGTWQSGPGACVAAPSLCAAKA